MPLRLKCIHTVAYFIVQLAWTEEIQIVLMHVHVNVKCCFPQHRYCISITSHSHFTRHSTFQVISWGHPVQHRSCLMNSNMVVRL